MKLTSILVILFLNSITITKAQELNCQVQVNHSQISGVSRQIFENMQKDISQFMNTHKWGNYVFDYNERIKCSFLINISSYSGNRFIATLQVVSNRPVFESSYESPILNYREQDKLFDFEYIENQNLEFNEKSHGSNLTAVLAYYAYIILGMDFDTFLMEGGTAFFQKAQNIVNNAQGSQNKGWKAYEARKRDNRYFLVKNLLDNRNGAARRAMYRYHRQGLDVMGTRLEAGRAEIAESLRYFQKVHRLDPNLFLLKIIMDAKSKELINIFSASFAAEKTKVANILKEIDPGRIKDYERLTKN
ncbi:MAG: DUF4835 domain-containing protein [Bacteroidetes bacterium]|nr:MAG: DUF4835 domain-containing protein [Bacteroidota bacterium]